MDEKLIVESLSSMERALSADEVKAIYDVEKRSA